jgi:hypothetical protein
MAAQKIRRKWQRFEDSIEKDYTRNRALQQMVGNLN